MTEFWHIIDRFRIHFASATSLVLAFSIGIRFARKKTRSKWLPATMYQTLIYAGLVLFSWTTLREPFDVYHGQTVTKAVFDFISWLSGIAFGIWGLYRWRYFDWGSYWDGS